MPRPKYRKHIESTDNTAQIGLMNNRRAYETIENRYNLALARKAKGKNNFRDDRLIEARDPTSYVHWARKASGAIKPVYPEFDLLSLGQGFGAGKVASKAFDKAFEVAAPHVKRQVVKGAYHVLKSRPMRPITRRGIEVAMRTAAAGNPIPEIKTMSNVIWSGHFGGKKRLFDIGNYILTGRKKGVKGWYNSLAVAPTDKEVVYYTGIPSPTKQLVGNDYIDAFLYGKRVDPRFGLKKVPTAPDFDGYAADLARFSQKKRNSVPTYEVIPDDNIVRGVTPTNISQAPSKFKRMDAEGAISVVDDRFVDTAGHNLDYDGDAIIRQTDLWQFLHDAYSKKYNTHGLLEKYGLKLVDDFGTPIITRTPWYRYKPNIVYNRGRRVAMFRNGGAIRINPANRGKFNATKRRTGKSTEELTHSKNPVTRKRAIFAQNAKKWRKRGG